MSSSDAAAMNPDRAWSLARPFLLDGLADARAALDVLASELVAEHPDALALLRARVALGENYAWNMYAPSTAWSRDRVRAERLDELRDAIVYGMLDAMANADAARLDAFELERLSRRARS